MDAGIPLATIQRWLGHHNISQTSTSLGASHGADERDMRVFEERMGRLTHVYVSAGQTGDEPTTTDPLVHGWNSTRPRRKIGPPPVPLPLAFGELD